MPRSIYFLLIAFCFPILLYSQVNKYSNDFLNIGIGARAQGMGGAVVASANDISAAYWNPAALASINTPFQLQAMHAEWFGGVAAYDYAAIGKPLGTAGKSFGAISVIRLGVDDIPNTLNLIGADGRPDYSRVETFSDSDYAMMASYSRKTNSSWQFGGGIKVIRRVVGSFANSWGFGLDAGALYDNGKLRFGVAGRDLSTTFNTWEFTFTQSEKEILAATGNDVPVKSTEITVPTISTGLAYRFFLSENITLTPEFDMIFSTDGKRNTLVSTDAFSMNPAIGVEATYKDIVSLRAGVSDFQKIKDDLDPEKENVIIKPAAGIGLKFGRLRVDYAVSNLGDISLTGYSHIFSLLLDLKPRGE